MGWCMSPDLFIAITICLVILCFVTLGLLFGFLLLRRELFPRRSPVNSRAPGLSEHDSPFGQTEARAERTIERPPDKPASARECGAASPPRAPEPSAARVG